MYVLLKAINGFYRVNYFKEFNLTFFIFYAFEQQMLLSSLLSGNNTECVKASPNQIYIEFHCAQYFILFINRVCLKLFEIISCNFN